ncbi:MAG: hypothetical protein K2Z81_02420, partial [Cyanobacteria bacterium]|nr:hypothetical protein [Cyanobacteriota bacterium]
FPSSSLWEWLARNRLGLQRQCERLNGEDVNEYTSYSLLYQFWSDSGDFETVSVPRRVGHGAGVVL